jgi:hypothetical protein
MNMKKKVIHITTGSRGYVGKEETWQEQKEKAIQSGATPATVKWIVMRGWVPIFREVVVS